MSEIPSYAVMVHRDGEWEIDSYHRTRETAHNWADRVLSGWPISERPEIGQPPVITVQLTRS